MSLCVTEKDGADMCMLLYHTANNGTMRRLILQVALSLGRKLLYLA